MVCIFEKVLKKGIKTKYQCYPTRGMQARGGDLLPRTIPPVGLLIVGLGPRAGKFDFD